VLGDVPIHSGDILIGDRDGVVVVPLQQAPAIASMLPEIKAAEQELDAKVRDGLQIPDFALAVLQSGKTRYLD
jgi:regulator of RNase E activity RraA